MNKNHLEEIKKKLIALEKRENLKSLLRGFLYFISSSAILVFFSSFLETLFHFNSEARTILFLINVLLIAFLFVWFILRPLISSFKSPDIFASAEKAGKNFPQINDELLNSLQLLKENENKNYSYELIDAAFENVYNKSRNLNFKDSVKFSSLSGILKKSLLVFSLSLILILLIPGIRASAFRLINYDTEFTIPPRFEIKVLPGNQTVTKGENVDLQIEFSGDLPEEFYLNTKSIEETGFNSKRLLTDSSLVYNENLKNIRNTLEYFIEADDIKTENFKITVIDRPQIKNFTLTFNPPAYSGIPQNVQKDNGNVTGLPGTKINLELESTKNLSKAEIVFESNDSVSMNISGKNALADFVVRRDDQYSISIFDEEGLKNNYPISYEIKTLNDENPFVEILSPAKDLNLPLDEIIFLTAGINDDYGFSKLNLNYKITSSKYDQVDQEFSQINIPFEKRVTTQEVYYTWDLTDLRLKSEDVVSYFLEVFDNDNINGPKSARSKIYKLRVPSMDELFVEAEEVHQSAEEDLVETLKEAEKLSEEIKEISSELKKDEREITWEEKEKIENAMQKFEELGEKVEEVKEKIDEMKNDLSDNELLSEETLQKYMELQQLFEEMNSQELKDAFNKMNEMLENLARKNVQNTFEEMKDNEEFFRKSIERTINLLKKIQVEQKVDELVKRTEELAEQQEELKNETAKSDAADPEKNSNLWKKQDEITESLGKMQKTMEDLKEKMSGLEDMPLEQMEKMLEEFKKQQNKNLSEEAKENMKNRMNDEAMKQHQQLAENMKQMNQEMQQMQNMMQQQNQMVTMQNMMKITDDLLTTSKDQEELKDNVLNTSSNSEQNKQNAVEQRRLSENVDKILKQMSDLSQKSFAITPEMGKAIGKAKAEMDMSMNALQNRNENLAALRQKNAMKSLNEAASMMKNMMNQMMNGSGSGGMMSMMQQMQQLSKQQMSLNQMTQQLQQGKMSQQQLAQLQKLAQQQDMIRKSLQQLNRESKSAGESKKLSGNLDKILEDMQEAVTRMNTQKVNDDLVKQQEKILSKLLDVQRSINERDFEKKRESESGNLIERESPAELLLQNDEEIDKIKDELIKAGNEGYTRDYQELIKKYFEALQKEELEDK